MNIHGTSSRSGKSRKTLAIAIAVLGIASGAGIAIWAVRRQRQALAGPEQSPQLPTGSPSPGSEIAQPTIISALWRSVRDGDNSSLQMVKDQLAKLSPELQAYIASASNAVREAYLLDVKFRKEFSHAFDAAIAEFDSANKQITAGVGVVASVGLIAMAAVNVVPIVGQIVSAVIAIGLAVYRAVLAGFPLENRKLEENSQIFTDWEGSDCLRGLHLEKVPNPSVAQLQMAIDTDLIASRLPSVPNAYQFEFTPTIEQYRLTAFKLGLYSEESLRRIYGFSKVWNLREGDRVPLSAVQITQYALGYTLGRNGAEYGNRSEWGAIGYTDAREGRAPRCSSELGLWAESVMAKYQPAEMQPDVAPVVPAEQLSAKDLRDYLDGYEEGKTNAYVGPQARASAFYNAGLLDGQAGKVPQYSSAPQP